MKTTSNGTVSDAITVEAGSSFLYFLFGGILCVLVFCIVVFLVLHILHGRNQRKLRQLSELERVANNSPTSAQGSVGQLVPDLAMIEAYSAAICSTPPPTNLQNMIQINQIPT